MNWLVSGEFFDHLYDHGVLSEKQCRFYIANVAIALKHMHNQQIAFRDLKPENLVLGAG